MYITKNAIVSLRSVILLTLLTFCASWLPLKAQQNLITLNRSDIPLSEAINLIEQQTNFSFFYTDEIDTKEKVSINIRQGAIEATLLQMFSQSPIRHRIIGTQIVLYKTALTNNTPLISNQTKKPVGSMGNMISTTNGGDHAQQTTNNLRTSQNQEIGLRGIVRDEKGNPLPDATIAIKGTRQITTTGSTGDFSFASLAPNATIIVSYIGYKTIEYDINGRAFVELNLETDAQILQDVVVTGYQTISRERAAGSFNVIRSESIAKSLSADISTALLGTTAGMQGKENSDGSIDFTIRGVGTLHADRTPLIVVDGFPAANGFKDVNPNDVESVTILKDAAAASIWGARSGNGVIVVITKRPKDMGVLKVDVNAMVRIGEKWDLSTVLTNASSKDQVAYEKYYYDNNLIMTVYNNTFSQIGASLSLATEYMYAHRNGQISEAEMNAGLQRLSETNNRGQIKDILLQNPVLQQYNIAVSKASQREKNYMSIQYENSLGNVIANFSDRWRLHYNNQTNLFKWLEFNFSTNLHYVRANSSGPARAEMANLSPYEMILNEDGSYATQLMRNRAQLAKIPAGALPYDDWSYNLLREVRGRNLTSKDVSTRVIAGLNFKVLNGLSYATSFLYEYNNRETNDLYGEDTYYVRDRVNNHVSYTGGAGSITAQFIPKGAILRPSVLNDENYSWRNQANFDRSFNNKHNVTALAGIEITENVFNRRTPPWIYGHDPVKNTSAQLPYGAFSVNSGGQFVQIKNITGANVASVEGANTVFGYRNDRYVSIYANFAYSFEGKYILTGSARSDASNLITDDPAYRWAPLWSIGGMWHAHREGFARNIAWLNRLTTRLTFGHNGNVDKTTSPYTLLSVSATPSLSTGTFTNSIAQMGNPTLRWEKTHTLNFAVDFAACNNMLFGSIEVYNKEGNDIIGTVTLPAVTGSSSKKLNVAGIYNRGFEVELGINARITNDVSISTRATYAYNKNKITKLFYPSVYAYQMIEGGRDGIGYVAGYPVNAMWAYDYLGMTDGTPYVLGAQGRPESFNSVETHTRGLGLQFLQYMGPIMDPHTLGWTGTVSGYGLNLSFLITGKFGGHFRNPTFNYNMLGTGKNIVPMFIHEVLNGSDKLPAFPLPNSGQAYLWDRYTPNLATMVESSSFLKFKEITLDYNLPKRWVDAIGLGTLKVYGQIRDLGCIWTANSRSYDPEWLPGNLKPSTTYALGLNITLK
ncbi:MAG: SusC/RagA family TonB-linked outer membrane protein [Bacteroidales bacterium]|nr:SusC/RagA family TonB-linked outer membrane protein [Bacteroidales bacterium]